MVQDFRPSLNVSRTPITGCQQCLPLSVVRLKCKQCRKPHSRNGLVDMPGPIPTLACCSLSSCFFESNAILTSISNPHCLCYHLTGSWSMLLKLSHLCYKMVSSFLSERNHCFSAPPSTFTSSHRNDDNYSNEDRCGAKAYLKVGGGWRLWNCVKNFWWQHRKEIFLMWF